MGIELKTKEILDIIKENNIKFFSYTVDNHYDTVYFLGLYYDVNKSYCFNDKYKFEVRSSKNQIKELMNIFDIDLSMMSCVLYEIKK